MSLGTDSASIIIFGHPSKAIIMLSQKFSRRLDNSSFIVETFVVRIGGRTDSLSHRGVLSCCLGHILSGVRISVMTSTACDSVIAYAVAFSNGEARKDSVNLTLSRSP